MGENGISDEGMNVVRVHDVGLEIMQDIHHFLRCR